MNAPGFGGSFVHTYDIPYHLAIVQQAPLSYRLSAGQMLRFNIQSEAFEQIAIVQNDKWTAMSKVNKAFTLNIAPHDSGELMVVGKKPGASNYTAILGYLVKP